MRKAPKDGKLNSVDEDIYRIISMVRVRVKHPFWVVKRRLGYVKIPYRGLVKNRAQCDES